MRPLILITMALATVFTIPAGAQTKKPTPTLKSILLDQLRSTHSKSDWFVCANVAVANLTPQQASWTDGKGNHSVGQLTYHLVFWNQRALEQFQSKTPAKFGGNNDETFTNFDPKQWNDLVHQLDQIMTGIETAVQNASDAQLAQWAPTLANISTHNAYHVGEIVMVRKEQGAWDASKGVK
jgi:DinB family protein